MKTLHLVSLLLANLLGMLWSQPSIAVPPFATKYEKNCSACHNAWPQLNKKGRQFKELGYRMPEDLKGVADSKGFFEPGYFPIGAMLVARPYDKRDSGDAKMRALHEAEVFLAGAVGRKFSGFFELEAEDETDFEIELPMAMAAYNHNRAFNASLVWGPFLFADPYGFLGDSMRLTRGSVGVINRSFGGADGDNGSILSERQSLSFSGRVADRFFYLAGIAGEADDAEGVEASNLFARAAFDITEDIMIGGFWIDGDTEERSVTSTGTQTVGGVPGVVVQTSTSFPDREFNRMGVDFQADVGHTRLQAAYVKAEDDDPTATRTHENDAWSIQAYHTFRTATGKPTWVPLLRYDTYESSDGAQEFDEITLNLSYYFMENVKGAIEYWDQLDAPSSANGGFGEDNRITLQLYVAF